MKDIQLKNAFPPVPEIVHQALEQALKEKDKMYLKQRKRPAAALCIALALLLALAGVAYAATKLGVLSYLVGGDEHASDGLKQMVQPVQATQTADNIRIDLTGAVYDGERLSLSFDMENLAPKNLAMVTLDTVTLNGDSIWPNFSSANEQWLPSVFIVDVPSFSRNPVYGGMLSDRIIKQYAGIIKGEATFVVTRPENGKLVVLDPIMWYDYDLAIEDADMRADYAARREAVKNSGAEIAGVFELNQYLDVSRWLGDGYTMVNADGEFLLNDSQYAQYRDETFGDVPGGAQQTLRTGQMKETARITISFTIDASKALARRVDLHPAQIELSDCTVRFDQFLLTPLSTLIRLSMIPKENTLEAAQALAARYALCELADENGAPLAFSDMEGEADGHISHEEALNVYELEFSYGGLNEYPKEIHFTPYAPSDGDSVTEDVKAAREAFSKKVYVTVQ